MHHAVIEHFAGDVDRHEKVAGMTGVILGGVVESVDAAAAARKDLADVLDCELHPMVAQKKAAGAVHIADALVAELAAYQDVVEQEVQVDVHENDLAVVVQVDVHENDLAVVVQEECLGLDLVKAANLVAAGFELQHDIVAEAIKVIVEGTDSAFEQAVVTEAEVHLESVLGLLSAFVGESGDVDKNDGLSLR